MWLGAQKCVLGAKKRVLGAKSASLGGQSASLGGQSASLGGQSASLGGQSASFGGQKWKSSETSQKKAKTYLRSFITFERLTSERFQHHSTAQTRDLDSKYGLSLEGPKNIFPSQVSTQADGWQKHKT